MIIEINKIAFIGAGTMGCYNALVAALAGYSPVIHDRDGGNLEQVPARLEDIGMQLAAHQGLSDSQLAEAYARVTTEVDLKTALAGAKLISESIFESLPLKQELHRNLDLLSDRDALLTTNTSALLPSAIESDVKHRERFAALHSYLGSPLIDVVPGSSTSPEVIKTLTRYVESLGCVPLLLEREYPGYCLNTLLGALLGTALGCVLGGFASREQLDGAWMSNVKAPMGPFGMIDMFGLDLVCDSWKNRVGRDPDDQLASSVVSYLQSFLQDGHLGMKSGQGFYSYPDPTYADPSFTGNNDEHSKTFFNILMSAVVGSACLLAARKVTSKANIDLCWTVGTGLSQGPFAFVEQQGVRQTLKGLQDIQASSPLMLAADFTEVEQWLQLQLADCPMESVINE